MYKSLYMKYSANVNLIVRVKLRWSKKTKYYYKYHFYLKGREGRKKLAYFL